MRSFLFLPLALIAACTGSAEDDGDPPARGNAAEAASPEPTSTWDMVASGEGAGLFLANAGGERGVHLFCPAGEDRLLVNVPDFDPVGSEERMSFGAAGTVVALVADPAGDRQRGGVSGEGPVPDQLAAIIAGSAGIAVNYGYQNVGPFPLVPADTARDFVESCTD